MTTACLVGSTGLVGSHILAVLNKHSTIHRTYAFCRRDLTIDPKTIVIQAADSQAWASLFPRDAQLFISALGTTARQAGSFANQKEIDHDLNIALAEAAKERGVKIYIMISTASADPDSMFPYTQMKGELDEAIKALGFERTIILKPGLLVGARNDSRPGEYGARKLATLLGTISRNRLKDGWAQDADVVAKAATTAALEAISCKNTEKIRILGQKDIVRLGRTEWGDETY